MICHRLELLGCGKKEQAPAQNETLSIGVVTPLTGQHSSYGEQTKKGVDLAIEVIIEAGGIGGRLLRAKYQDDLSTKNGGLGAIRNLIEVEKVPVIIGGFTSGVTLSIAPVAERKRVVLVSASSTHDSIKYAGDYIFRIVPANAQQGTVLADFAHDELGAKRAAMLFMNSDYGVTLSEAIESRFIERGGRLRVSCYQHAWSDGGGVPGSF